MALKLTKEEEELILIDRKRKAKIKAKSQQKSLDARPASELTKEELVDRLNRIEAEQFIERALNRRTYERDYGYYWAPGDEQKVKIACSLLGREMPLCIKSISPY